LQCYRTPLFAAAFNLEKFNNAVEKNADLIYNADKDA
jgi:hypothetical protein